MTTRILRGLSIALLALGMANPARVLALSVHSADIVQADGSSGQIITTGNGVKTGHLQDGAVTNSKLAGSIDPSKIIQGSGSGLNADKLDGQHASDFALAGHNHDGVYEKKYGRVAVVAVSGGDFSNPFTAMANIGTWCGSPSASAPCLLKIMPGLYNIGTNEITVPSYVDVEGCGAGVTTVNGQPTSTGSVIRAAGTSEIRLLTVEHTGSYGIRIASSGATIRNVNIVTHAQGQATAVSIWSTYSTFVAEDVHISHTGANMNGWIYAIWNLGSGGGNGNAALTNVTIEMSGLAGIAIYAQDCQALSMENVKVTVPPPGADQNQITGVHSDALWPTTINNSLITGQHCLSGYQFQVRNSTLNGWQDLLDGGWLWVVNSMIVNQTVSSGTISQMLGCYDGNFNPIPFP